MNRIVVLGCLALALGSSGRGNPVDRVILAAMKLPEARNYSWSAAVQDDGRFYTIDGQTEKDGYTRVSMPMISAIQRRLGDNDSEIQTAIFDGDNRCVISTPDGWKTPAEIGTASIVSPAAPVHRHRHSSHSAAGAGSSTVSAGGGPGADNFRYSNLQLNLSHPHEEIGVIVGSYVEMQPDAEGASGRLSEDGAKLLLVHPGQDQIAALRAEGAFKLWIKEGVLVKYEVKLTGVLSITAGSSHREIPVHETVTTELKSVGTTKFDVPDEAKRKLQ